MNKWIEILLGLILVIVPVVLVLPGQFFASWGIAAVEVLKGGVVIFLVMIGLLFLVLGISDLK